MRLIETIVRKERLDHIAEDVLRAVLACCSVRLERGGRFQVRQPPKITLEQQLGIVAPITSLASEDREGVIGQLQHIASLGPGIARMVRLSLANPYLSAAGRPQPGISAPPSYTPRITGNTTFDRYLTVCRNSRMHWGIIRALQHLRDVLTVTEEQYFTDPSKHDIKWRLHADRITPTMLKHVADCLRTVDARALHEPACERWLAGLRAVFERIKAGTFRLPDRPAAAGSQSKPDVPPAGGEAASTTAASESSPRVAPRDDLPAELREMHRGLWSLRQYLLPQYLDLSPEEFAALCRSDDEARDFARRLSGAIERFSIHCLGAVREKFLAGCAARAGETGSSPESVAAEMGRCMHPLAEEGAAFRRWLGQELPQADGTVGRRLMELAESSLVAGLFCLFLQRRFADLFRDIGDEPGGRPRPRAESESGAVTQPPVVRECDETLERLRQSLPAAAEKPESPNVAQNAAKCCEAVLSALLPLLHLAARGLKREAAKSTFPLGKPRHRFLSAKGVFSDARQELLEHMEFVEYEPGSFPSLRCEYRSWPAGPGASPQRAQVSRFSRRGGVMLSPQIAIPISTLFGDESGAALAANFLAAEADRHLAEWSRLAKDTGFRQCLPYLERNKSQFARIEVRAGGPSGDVVLLALPTAAVAMSDELEESVAFLQAIEDARGKSPATEAVLRVVEARWREKGVAANDYSLCMLGSPEAAVKQDTPEAREESLRRRKVRRFLNQKSRWPLEEAEEILRALGIVIEAKEDGAPHGRVRFGDRHHTLSSKLLKDGQVYANYLHEWISTLGQERMLAELLKKKDLRLAGFMRKADAGEV